MDVIKDALKFTIITASYNYGDYIKETIESVLAQTYCNWEMIIVDDGSKDNSVDVIKNYCKQDNRIKLYQHENAVNKGLVETVKLGLQKATSDWIIFLESDDTITPNYIERKLEVINQYPDIKFIYNDVNLFGDFDVNDDFFSLYFPKFYKFWEKQNIRNCAKGLETINLVPTFSCVMLNKIILEGLDFNPKSQKHFDWYLWSQLAYKNDFYFIKEKLTNWRLSPKSYIHTQDPAYDIWHFREIQIKNNITGGKFKLWHWICFFFNHLKYYKQKIIKLRFNSQEKSLYLFKCKMFEIKHVER